MESLGQLLKQMNGPSFLKKSQAIFEELLHDPIVRELRAERPEMDEDKLRANLPRLYQYVHDQRNCRNCPGLDRCPNDFEGHYSKLEMAEQNGKLEIVERKAPCSLQIAKHNEERIRKRIRSFYVDERALEEGYNEVEIMGKDRLRAPAVSQVFRYIREVKDNGLQPRGLYLFGSFGTGKTFLMSYLLHELAIAGYTGVIVYMPEFMEDLKSMLQDSQKLKETVEVMKNCDLLILDDIGAENLSPWVRDHVLGAILNYRMNRKPTFYTSNYDLASLEKHLSFTSKDGEELYKGQRLMDRISPFVDVVHLHGENQRRNRS
ncbi:MULTISPECIES: primosomal protein DnaI [Paenibacillus]|uniref:Primosomal protein DnaI n=1 Tax=Paenibacillus albilobatus TaxID=2716884 RepID=A0A919XLX0_9BACL|nr:MULTISPECIES: primosomal protein DnaI [Paenibacillus]GIO33833.1 primosomal protein DnaI [Paenibacillus albilobatus]